MDLEFEAIIMFDLLTMTAKSFFYKTSIFFQETGRIDRERNGTIRNMERFD